VATAARRPFPRRAARWVALEARVTARRGSDGEEEDEVV
jgi:hypothetical protein